MPDTKTREHHFHIGMRKVKSLLAIFIGFWLWQLLRLFIPGLEVHPLFIYIYSFIEIRETSEKTKDFGRKRIFATFAAIGVALPTMLLVDGIDSLLAQEWMHIGLQVTLLLLGSLLVLWVAEWIKCQTFCGLAAVIYIILMISHFKNSMYLYSLMRVFQTIIGVAIAWVLNVKLFPHPATPGSLSYWLLKRNKKKAENTTLE